MSPSPAAPRTRRPRTAFVFAGGGSLGAIQVGMLKTLVASGETADMVVGSSVGSINGAYFAGRPDAAGVAQLEQLWLGLRRQEIFALKFTSLARFAWRRDYLVESDGLSHLIARNLPYERLEAAAVPLHIVATDVLSGEAVVLSSGPAVPAILASCAIPAAFAPVRIGRQHLADGGVASNTPVKVAVGLGAERLIVLPTGFSCALPTPPDRALGSLLHSLTLLTSRQLVLELESLAPEIDYHVVPSLCPLTVGAFDFSQTQRLIDDAADQTAYWLDKGGLGRREVPDSLRLHGHADHTH